MNIKQAAEQSGVSARNIRYYEQAGLLTPARNPENEYRIYSQADVRTLKLIRMLRTLDKRLAGMDMSCQVSDRAVAEIAKAGFDPVYGARPLRRAIQSKIEDTLSEQLLTGKFRAGDVIQIDAENGEFQFSQAT